MSFLSSNRLIEESMIFETMDAAPQEYYIKGLEYIDKRDYKEAYKNFIYSLNLINNDYDMLADIYMGMGDSKFYQQDYETSNIYYNLSYKKAKQLRKEKMLYKLQYKMAKCNKEMGKYLDAIVNVNYIIQLQMENISHEMYINARLLKAQCYSCISQFNEAIEVYESLIKIKDLMSYEQQFKCYMELAWVLAKVNKFTESHEQYSKALKVCNKHFIEQSYICTINESEVYMLEGKYKKAIDGCKEGIMLIDNKDAYELKLKAYKILENIYDITGQIQDREKIIKDAIKFTMDIDRKDVCVQYYHKLQEVYFYNKKYNEAYECYDKIRIINQFQ